MKPLDLRYVKNSKAIRSENDFFFMGNRPKIETFEPTDEPGATAPRSGRPEIRTVSLIPTRKGKRI
ncbi:MAG: hypothetical protein IJY50_08855 [Clostridia bacterium]|nr:hypothetical protein [Clostridia bacterium]